MPNTAAWIDTGFFVALFARDDRYHASAVQFLKTAGNIEFHSVWPVVAEAGFFLDVAGKLALIEWLGRGPVTFHDIGLADLPAVAATLQKYRDLKPDFTDAVLVTLAAVHGIGNIVTVDVRDFSAFRLPGGHSLNRLWL